MKIVLISNYADSLMSFRGALLSELVNKGHEVIACAPGENEQVSNELHSIGVKYRAIELDRTGVNPVKDFISLLKLMSLFRKESPDMVVSYTIKPTLYASLAARLAGVPHFFSVITGLGYTFMNETYKQRLLNLLVRGLYKVALSENQSVFFLNPDDLSLFLKNGLVKDAKRTVLINGEGLDLNYFRKIPLLIKPPTFLLIARLLKDKGIIEYVEASRILKKHYPHVVFRLVGPRDTNPSAIQEAQVGEWQKEGIIEYLGETRDVRPFIADCSVYVLPSYREGTPRTVLEAMAMGRPIVTTDAPGCRETVIEGENGFLVPIKNADALVQAMERFIVQPELIEKLGKRSREIAEEKYDVHKVNAVIMKTMGLLDEKTV